jgi:hypothetical protein
MVNMGTFVAVAVRMLMVAVLMHMLDLVGVDNAVAVIVIIDLVFVFHAVTLFSFENDVN